MELTKGQSKEIRSLSRKKDRDALGAFVAEGFKIIEDALVAGQSIELLVIKGEVAHDERTKAIMSSAGKKSIPVAVVKNKEFDALSALETPPGILAVIKKNKATIKEGNPLLIIDAVKDPGNLGTIIRTADWFGFHDIIVGEGSVDVYNPKVVQACMGSLFHSRIVENKDLKTFVEELKGYNIIAASLNGTGALPRGGKAALIVGNESSGVSPELLKLATHVYTISGRGNAESLNVAVATGVILFQLTSS